MTDRRLLVKCAWRLIPVMGLLYLVNYIDRVNAGFAALTMNKDLGFSPSVFGLGAGRMFVEKHRFTNELQALESAQKSGNGRGGTSRSRPGRSRRVSGAGGAWR